MSKQPFRLLTNIFHVQLMRSSFPIQLHCHALVLQAPKSRGDDTSALGCISGFMTDGALQVFTLPLRCGPLDYEVETANDPIIMTTDGEANPKFSGHNHRLVFRDGTELLITPNSHEDGLDLIDYADISEVWGDLPRKVLEYWRSPNVPVRHYIPIDVARDDLIGYGA